MEQDTHAIYLIRHAESTANMEPEYVAGRQPDPPLTDRGVVQAVLLGRYLRGAGVEPVLAYVSKDTARTAQTARYVLAAMEVAPPVVEHQDLVELDQGEFAHKLRSTVYTPQEYEVRDLQGEAYSPPGGESLRTGRRRMERWLGEHDDRFGERPGMYLAFGHDEVISALIGGMQGWTARQMRKARPLQTSITELRRSPSGIWRVERFNDIPHNPPLKFRPLRSVDD